MTAPTHSALRGTVAQLAAEFIGTFALVFVGTGAIAADSLTGGEVGQVGIALAFGAVIAVMIYAYGKVSGAHYNPAVTIALWQRGVFSGRRVTSYIAAQVLGALSGSALLAVIVRPLGNVALGATVPISGGVASALSVEVAATFLLVTVILGVVRAGDRADPWAGTAVGATVTICALSFGPISGASMNPARSFGPLWFTAGALQVYWIYLVGPVIGASIAVLVDRLIPGGSGIVMREADRKR